MLTFFGIPQECSQKGGSRLRGRRWESSGALNRIPSVAKTEAHKPVFPVQPKRLPPEGVPGNRSSDKRRGSVSVDLFSDGSVAVRGCAALRGNRGGTSPYSGVTGLGGSLVKPCPLEMRPTAGGSAGGGVGACSPRQFSDPHAWPLI